MGEVDRRRGPLADAQMVSELQRPPLADPMQRAAVRAKIHAELFGATDSPPLLVGRYRIQGRLGQGSMGVVYRAFDPELSRDVAIKIISSSSDVASISEVSTELRREARALARVQHGNVLPCYDVCVLEDDGRAVPYVVTELVEGTTMAQWMAEPRTVGEICDMFVRAGRGLAAVHDEGFVHRDFKPSNVLLGNDGRVVVSDFGLAKPLTAVFVRSDPADSDSGDASGSQSRAQTATDTMVAGTLAYMAPEQQQGKRCGPQADQFAFCAALYEALSGQRPFGSGTWDEVLARKLEGPPDWRGQIAPRRLQRIVRRGLRPDPAARFGSMTELVEVLQRGGQRRREIATPLALTGVVGGGLMVGFSSLLAAPPAERPCVDARAWDDVWNDERRHALRGAIESELDPARVHEALDHLDAHVARWELAAADACEERSNREAELDAVQACLRTRVAAVQTLIEVMSSGNRVSNVPATIGIFNALPDPAQCNDARAHGPWPNDPEMFVTVAQARRILGRATLLERARLLAEAEDLLDEVPQGAEVYPPLRAELLRRRGNLAMTLGRGEEARALLTEAVDVARTAGHDRVVAGASSLLIYLAGEHDADLDAAKQWARHAEAALERGGGDDDGRGLLLYSLGVVHTNAGHYDAAIDYHEEALRIREDVLGPETTQCATSHHGLGNVYAHMGRFDEAITHYREALRIEELMHGPHSAAMAETLDNIGKALAYRGELVEAREYNERAARLLARNYPAGHPKRLTNRELEAFILQAEGKLDESFAEQEAIAKAREEALGSAHPDLAYAFGNLGHVARELGRKAVAERYYIRALSIRDAIDPSMPQSAGTLTGLGLVRLERGEAASAIEPLQRALENLGPDGDPHQIADARLVLARALDALDGDPAEVTALAEAARDTYRELSSQNLALAEDFLADRGDKK